MSSKQTDSSPFTLHHSLSSFLSIFSFASRILDLRRLEFTSIECDESTLFFGRSPLVHLLCWHIDRLGQQRPVLVLVCVAQTSVDDRDENSTAETGDLPLVRRLTASARPRGGFLLLPFVHLNVQSPLQLIGGIEMSPDFQCIRQLLLNLLVCGSTGRKSASFVATLRSCVDVLRQVLNSPQHPTVKNWCADILAIVNSQLETEEECKMENDERTNDEYLDVSWRRAGWSINRSTLLVSATRSNHLRQSAVPERRGRFLCRHPVDCRGKLFVHLNRFLSLVCGLGPANRRTQTIRRHLLKGQFGAWSTNECIA